MPRHMGKSVEKIGIMKTFRCRNSPGSKIMFVQHLALVDASTNPFFLNDFRATCGRAENSGGVLAFYPVLNTYALSLLTVGHTDGQCFQQFQCSF